ncbi:MAG: MerR family transcriptional regulator [Alistipes sp.]
MAEKLFYSMGEVAEMFDVNASLLRHWESQFSVLRPKRNKKGNRLFTPQDVENIKLIYHLVKECGMTLEGAKKALRQHSTDDDVSRDAELTERLQRIRSLLVEVREDLKSGEDEVVADDGVEPFVEPSGESSFEPFAQLSAAAEAAAAGVAQTDYDAAAEQDDQQSDATSPAADAHASRGKRGKRGKADDKELFAFYEQSLF